MTASDFKKDVLYNAECLAGMQQLPPNSFDMILCDLPYVGFEQDATSSFIANKKAPPLPETPW